jgi:hypothetical protein
MTPYVSAGTYNWGYTTYGSTSKWATEFVDKIEESTLFDSNSPYYSPMYQFYPTDKATGIAKQTDGKLRTVQLQAPNKFARVYLVN